MKKLWHLLPLGTFWVVYYIGYYILPEHPLDTWWSIPLAFTLFMVVFASFFFAMDKAYE